MQKLIVRTAQYEYLEKGFREWLDILGYNPATVKSMPIHAHELFHFLEGRGITEIRTLHQKDIKAYHDHISTRPNYNRGGALSEKYILMQIQAVEKLLEYLHHRGIHTITDSGLRLRAPKRKEITVLTTEEVKALFETTKKEVTTSSANRYSPAAYEAMGARDRAMLTIYYSCGLRRNEGVHVDLADINFDTRILHVRKGKNYKERFVPFGKSSALLLQEYIYDHRPRFIKDKREGRLFVSFGGRVMSGGTLAARLQKLQSQSEEPALMQKRLTLHVLRHSIATHLLGAGMSLEKIAKFLGHATMDSTQIYTHLVDKEQ